MKLGGRITIVLVLLAGSLVTEWMAPARALFHPRTLSARHAFHADARTGTLHLQLAATHAMFSWTGDEGSGVRFRYARDGLPTRWRQAPESHDMEHGGTHYSAPLLLRRSRYVEWKAFGGARRIAIDYVNTVDGPIRRTVVPSSADAAAADPDIITRAEWGADESHSRRTGSCTRGFYDLQQVFVHHTVTGNFDPNPPATVRAIYHFHTQSRGWCDIGYNFLVAANGQTFEGRWARPYRPWETHDGEDESGRVVAGAHTAGANSGSVGISVLGNYETTSLRAAGRRSLISLLAWEVDRHNLKARGSHTFTNPSDGSSRHLPYIAGHRDAGQTSCPGRYLYRALPSIRRAVDRTVGDGKGDSRLEAADTVPVVFGDVAESSFRLTRPDGLPLADRLITFFTRGGGRWTVAGKVRTDLNGWASLELSPRRNLKIAGVWRGSADRWGADASAVQLVRPAVTIAPEGGVETTPGRYDFPQGTTEIYFGGNVAPNHRGDNVVIRTWQKQADQTYLRLPDRDKRLNSESIFRAKQDVPPHGGTYRVAAVMRAHGDHARGWSRTIELVVPPPTP